MKAAISVTDSFGNVNAKVEITANEQDLNYLIDKILPVCTDMKKMMREVFEEADASARQAALDDPIEKFMHHNPGWS